MSPQGPETVESNLRDAEWWLVALQRANPELTFVSQWILELRLGIGDNSVLLDRELGLERCYTLAAQCDGIVLCGPRISRDMLGELRSAADVRGCEIHRFRSRDQCFVLPNIGSVYHCDFGDSVAPMWLRRSTFGAVPGGSIDVVGAEVLEAIERYRTCRL